MAAPNSLAKLPAEVRIIIFKHYFESYSLNLLIALRGAPFSRQYDEALEQYRLSTHLLYTERGKDMFDKAPT